MSRHAAVNLFATSRIHRLDGPNERDPDDLISIRRWIHFVRRKKERKEEKRRANGTNRRNNLVLCIGFVRYHLTKPRRPAGWPGRKRSNHNSFLGNLALSRARGHALLSLSASDKSSNRGSRIVVPERCRLRPYRLRTAEAPRLCARNSRRTKVVGRLQLWIPISS